MRSPSFARRGPTRAVEIALTCAFALLGTGSAMAQIDEEKLCETEGNQVTCDFRLRYGASSSDIQRIENLPFAGPLDPTDRDLTYSVQDTWAIDGVVPGTTLDLRTQTLEGTEVVRGPAPPQFSSGFGDRAINGNAACSSLPGESCDPVSGEGCTTPCILCPPRFDVTDDGIDDTKPGGPPGSGLACPSVDSDDDEFDSEGTIFFRTNFSVPPPPTCVPDETISVTVEDEAIVFNRPSCEPGITGQCNPNSRQYDDGDQTTLVEFKCPSHPPVNDFKCYAIKPEPRSRFERRAISITDQFGSRGAMIARPFEICAPVDKNGEGIQDPEAHLTCYKLVSRQRDSWRILGDIDQFTTPVQDSLFVPESLIVGRAAELCLPAVKNCEENEEGQCGRALEAVQERLSHFQCYQARSIAEDPLVPGLLSLADQFASTTSDVGAAIKHCNPLTGKALDGGSIEELPVVTFPPDEEGGRFWEGGEEVHLKCYGLEDETRLPRTSVEIRDQLYPDGYRVRVGNSLQLCEPAVKVLPQE